MNNPIITGGQTLVIPSLKNNNVAVFESYKVVPFAINGSDAACVARIIEIHTLNKLREEGETLFSLTGLTVPDTEAVAEEINALVARCVKICRREEDEFSFRQREAAEAQAVMNQASGKSNTVSEARTRRGSSMERADAERRYQAALTLQTVQQSRLELVRSLPGLLSAEAEYIGKGINTRLLNTFPRTLRIPSGVAELFTDTVMRNIIIDFTDGLNALTAAMRAIIRLCSYPTDRYLLNNGGKSRTEAYRKYYRAENALLRAIISDQDYADYMAAYSKADELKNKLFSR
ncbi:hypothetical protein [Franconibacter helveticus]|uniref:hypothetical protein n=1 Tax=Franconibacter helveticus TaxID=357240 RepID=UPI002908C0D7|nr:hypothetical protein [Franconibacter helveticus]MDU6926229.1 hypothetical protein [Franconibacter helveticus]